MKKKILLTVLLMACTLTCVFALAACDLTSGGNEDNSKIPTAFTVNFETNGGNPIDSVTSENPKRLSALLDGKTTEKKDKVFVGWYYDSLLETEAFEDDYIEEDTTLYAAWRDYTDYELLEIAINNTYNDAIGVHDTGTVRFGVTDYSVVDVKLALKNGVITAGSRGDKYYMNNFFYYGSSGNKVKLKEKLSNTATEFLYLKVVGTVNYKQRGFYSTFAPMATYRIADTSYCSFQREGDTFTVTYNGNSGGIELNWEAQGNPWIFFDAGKKFKFTVSDNRVVKVEQIQTELAYRTIEFFYEGDADVPVVDQPEDESSYVQKWQVIADGRNMLLTELDKAYMDKIVYGDRYAEITKNQTYYYDEEMTEEVQFNEEGKVALNDHLKLYHPSVN